MKEKMKKIGSSVLSLCLAFSMVFSGLMLPDIIHINDTKEASAKTYGFDITPGTVDSSGINVLNFADSALKTITMEVKKDVNTDTSTNYEKKADISRQIFHIKKGNYYKTYTYDKANRKLYSVYSDHIVSLNNEGNTHGSEYLKGKLEGGSNNANAYAAMDINKQNLPYSSNGPKNVIDYIKKYTKQFVNDHPAYKTPFENNVTINTLELPSINYPFYTRVLATEPLTDSNKNYYGEDVYTSDFVSTYSACTGSYAIYELDSNSSESVYIKRLYPWGGSPWTVVENGSNNGYWYADSSTAYLGIVVTLPTDGILTPTANSPSATLTKQSIITDTASQITDSYKLMLTDSTNAARNSLTAPSIKGKNINRAAKGITYTFDVKGVNINQERSGDKKYVSAIIYDKDKNPVYYGRLAGINNLAQKVGTVNSSSTNSAGTTVKEQTRDMSVQMTIPNDLYESDKYMLAVFEETESSDGTRTMSSPEYANLTVSGIENIYAENAAMSGSNKGKSTEKHNNTSTEPVSDTSLVSDSKTYYDDQTITDKSNWIVEENVVNAKDVGSAVIRQEVLGANDYYVMDYDNWEYYAAYLYVKDHTSEQTRYSYKIDTNGNVGGDTAAINYTQCGNDKQRKAWLKLVTDEYRKSGLIKTMTNNWVPKEADMKSFDTSALGLNCLNSVHIPKLADGTTKGTKDIIFLRFHDYNGTPAFFSYKKTLQVKTQATDDTDEKTIVEADKWHTWTDGKGVEWTYMVNGNGEVIYLYTKDATAMNKLIVSGAHDEESYDLPENDILMLPDSINGLPVVGIGGGTKDTPIFPYITTVKNPLTAGEDEMVADSFDSISFPSTIRKINDYAFYESTAGYNYQISEDDDGGETAATKATGTITIPNTVKEIGNYAFSHMPYITDITVNADGTKIDYRAFDNCDRVESIRVINTDNKGIVGERAFADNSKTRYIVISGNVDIKERAFANNANLGKYNKKLSYGLNIDGMTGTIGFEAFADDINLASLYIPDTVTMEESIDKEHGYQFRGCSALKEVEYDAAVLNNHVFADCGAITDLILGDGVKTVEADWGGYKNGTVKRNIYVKSATTKFVFAKNGTIYTSGFGFKSGVNTGTVTIHYKDTDNADIPLADTVRGNISSVEKKKDSDVKPHFTANGAATITFDLVDAGATVTDKNLHSKATIKGIEVTLKKGLYENSTVTKKNFIVKPEMSDSSTSQDIYDDYYMMSEDEWKAVQAAADAKRIFLATKENFITAIKDAKVSADRFSTPKLNENDTAAFINVVFIRYADEAGATGYFIKKLTIPYSKLTDEAAKDQILDNIGVSSYTELAEKVTELTDEVAYWREQVKELSGMSGTDDATIEEMKAAMEKAQKDLTEYTIMYNALVEQMNKLNESIGTKNDGYFVDKKTEDGIVKVIYINGKEFSYTETGDIQDGHKLYETTGDIDGNGEDEDITYWVDENGVHVIKKNGEILEKEILYKDDIASLQRRLTAQLLSMQSDLAKANDELKAIENKIKALKGELGIDDEGFDDLSKDEQLGIIYNKVVDMNKKILSYNNVIKSIYKQLASEDLTDEQLKDIDNVLQTITAKITKLKEDNKNLSDEVDSKNETIKDLNSKLDESTQTVDSLNKQIDKMKSDAAALDKTIKDQQQTISDMTERVGNLEQSNESLNNEITTLNGNISDLKSNNEKQTEQINSLQTTLSSKDEEIANNTATIEDLNKVISDAKKEAATLKATNTSQADIIKELQGNVTNLTNIKDEQATQIAGLKDNVSTLKEQNTTLSDKVQSLTATIKEQENTIAELKKQLAAQKELVEQLQKESKQYLMTTSEAIKLFGLSENATKEEIMDAINSFIAAKTTLGKIQTAFATDKNGDELVAFLKAKTSGSTNNGSAGTTTPSNGSNASDGTSYASGYKDGFTAGQSAGSSSNNSLQPQYATLSAENKELTSQLNTLTDGIDDLYDAIPATGLKGASGISDSISKLEKAKIALSSLDESNKNLGEKYNTLSKKNISLIRTNKSLTSTNKSLTSTNKTLNSTNKKLKATNSTLASKNKSLESKNKSLASQNNKLTAINQSLASSVNSLRTSLQNTKNNSSAVAGNTSAVTSEPSKGSALTSEASQKKKEQEKKKDITSSKSSESTEAVESTESTESTEEDTTNLPTLEDKADKTSPIYETPDIEQGTESSNGGESDLSKIPGDTESTEPTPDELNDSGSSLPIMPIVCGVVVVVGIAVIMLRKKKQNSEDVE